MITKIKQIEKDIKDLAKDNIDTLHLEKSLSILRKEYTSKLSAWQRVEIARDKERKSTMFYIDQIFTNVIELHGDRYYGDDKAIFGAVAKLNEMPVTIIGIKKGLSTEENIETNFGMVHPEGYRKALRLMKQAEKFKRPIITFIDTPGAYPGIEAEERGQGEAIAKNLMEMMDLSVPIISIVLGEAGSGGALALAVANQVWMLENAIYSILSPEGFASILFKDASKASEVADMMKITSNDLLNLGVIDQIILENSDETKTSKYLKDILYRELSILSKQRGSKVKNDRYKRFRNMGDIIHEKQNS